MLKQLLEVIIFESVLQGENFDNPSSVLYLKMKMNGRVEAAEFNQIHFLLNKRLIVSLVSFVANRLNQLDQVEFSYQFFQDHHTLPK